MGGDPCSMDRRFVMIHFNSVPTVEATASRNDSFTVLGDFCWKEPQFHCSVENGICLIDNFFCPRFCETVGIL